MRKDLLGKTLVLGVILLFIGVGVQPALSNEVSIFMIPDDTTPPVTTISLNGTMSEHGIFTGDVEVTLNATDDMSGVNVTYYRLDTGELEIYNEPFIVTGHLRHVLTYWSVDNAGNKEKIQVAYIRIDLRPPEIRLSWERLDNKRIKFEPYVMDDGSGVYKVEYYIDDVYMYTTYGENHFGWIWTPNSTGWYMASGIVYDKADHSTRDDIWINIAQDKEDCNCQKLDRHNPIMVKLLLNKLKVFTTILLSRFGHNPEVKEKCQELLGAINSFDPLSDNPRIICEILAGLNIFFGTISEKIEEYLDKSFDEDPLLIALLKWLILSPFWTASGVISAAFFMLGVALWCWDFTF